MKDKKAFLLSRCCCVFWLLFSLLVGGCVVGGGVSSRGQRSLEVEELFRSATIVPGHTYYVQGILADPEAIMALKDNVQLRSRLWSRVEWTEKELGNAVFWMQNSERGFCTIDGGYLTASDGRTIGIWYSNREVSMIREPAPNVVEVYPFDFTIGSPCQKQAMMDER